MTDPFIKEIQDTFLAEAEEVLQKSECLFLALEKPGDHSEVYANLKRLAHNFKGSGKAVGFDALSLFSHRFENLLIALSDGRIKLNDQVMQLLLECNDRLKIDITQLQADSGAILNHDVLINQMDAMITGQDLASLTSAHIAAPTNVVVSAPSLLSSHQTTNFVQPARQAADRITSSAGVTAPVHSPAVSSVQTGAVAVKDDSIRIPMKRIDELLDAFGEQVIYLSALDHFKDDLELHKEDVVRTIFNLKKLAFDIQQSTLALRMVTLKTLFSKLERSIRDSAKMTQKKVECVLIGADQELDKIIVDQLSDPLTHMVRNAVDHGLENADERLQTGKSEVGTVTITANREGGSFVIEIKDDGKGLDPKRIHEKGVEKGLLRPGDSRSDKEIFDLIFENGFSTKENVSELSGRGVGMNVVKEMILSLKGTCEIDSSKGKGTSFKIKLPLSLSLFNGILFQVDGNRYLVPSTQVAEIIDIADVEVKEVSKGKQIVHVRDEVLDLIDLSILLKNTKPHGIKGDDVERPEMVLISETHSGRVGFLVQKILSIQRVVQKPLSPEVTACAGAVGVTILGDGYPSVILDLNLLKDLSLPKRLAKSLNQVLVA